MLMGLFILNLTFSHKAHADDQPKSCDFESLTDNCSMFSAKGKFKIDLPDGTFIPNISALSDAANLQPPPKDDAQLEKELADQNNRQLDIVDVLDEIPRAQMSNAMKFMLAQSPSIVGKIVTRKGFKADETISLPWPPEKSDARVSNVPASEVTEKINSLLTEEQRVQLLNINAAFKPFNIGAAIANMMRARHPLSEEMNQIKDPRKKRAEELVEFVRDSVIKNIVGTKPEKEWTDAEHAAVDKIRTIKYRAGDNPKVKENLSCLGVVPNAFYQPGMNTINICPGFYNYPDATLVAVLAHEMGHAVDPCGCQQHHYSFNVEKFDSLSETDRQLPNEIKDDADLKETYDSLKNLKESGSNITAYPFAQDLKDPAKLKYFIDKGVLQPGRGQVQTVTQNGNDMNGYILADVYKCLATDAGGPFRQTTKEEIETVADLVVSKRKAVADQNYDAEKDKEKIVRAYTRFPQCISPRSETQMREAVSDWFGAKVLGEFLRNKKLHSKEERLSTIAYFASLVCKDRAKISANGGEQSVNKTVQASAQILGREEGAHPGSKVRIEKIFLAEPDVREALGCAPKENGSCIHSTGGGGGDTQSSSRSER